MPWRVLPWTKRVYWYSIDIAVKRNIVQIRQGVMWHSRRDERRIVSPVGGRDGQWVVRIGGSERTRRGSGSEWAWRSWRSEGAWNSRGPEGAGGGWTPWRSITELDRRWDPNSPSSVPTLASLFLTLKVLKQRNNTVRTFTKVMDNKALMCQVCLNSKRRL